MYLPEIKKNVREFRFDGILELRVNIYPIKAEILLSILSYLFQRLLQLMMTS